MPDVCASPDFVPITSAFALCPERSPRVVNYTWVFASFQGQITASTPILRRVYTQTQISLPPCGLSFAIAALQEILRVTVWTRWRCDAVLGLAGSGEIIFKDVRASTYHRRSDALSFREPVCDPLLHM